MSANYVHAIRVVVVWRVGGFTSNLYYLNNHREANLMEILTVKEDMQTGELGLCFDSLVINPDLFMVTTDPIQIAHDYCEHVNGIKAIGSIHDEFEALGGIQFVRGYNEVLRRDSTGSYYSFDQNLASDIVRMWTERGYIDFQPWTGEAADMDTNVIYEARLGMLKEYERSEMVYSEYREYLHSAAAYMALGYEKASQRYESQGQANDLFWAMCEAVERLHIDYQGQQFQMHINEAEARVSVDEYYGEDYE